MVICCSGPRQIRRLVSAVLSKDSTPLRGINRKLWSVLVLALVLAANTARAVGPAEVSELTFGFIKLTDMAPLAIAQEKGYFKAEGLDVTLVAQQTWGQVADAVAGGALDGAHMLAGQPLAARAGYGTTQGHIVTPISMDLNGNAITVSNAAWKTIKPQIPKGDDGKPVHPIKADFLKPLVEAYRDRDEYLKLGMVFPVSTHNYELRYWLAAGGIHPGYYNAAKSDAQSRSGWVDADVHLFVTPPPQMPVLIERGSIEGYCVGEPWNQHAVFQGVGVPVITDHDIWKNNPEKVFGLSAEFVDQHPNTTVRIVKALLRAAKWLDEDDNANRQEAVEILARPEYVGAPPEVIANSMTGTFEYEKGDKRPAPDFNVFFRHFATYPYYSDAVWYLTQMRRWGQIAESKSDQWYLDTAKAVYRPDLYAIAARELVEAGHMSAAEFPNLDSENGFRPAAAEFIDGVEFDGRQPNAYLRKFSIGLKD